MVRSKKREKTKIMNEIFKEISWLPNILIGSHGTIKTKAYVDKNGLNRKSRILKQADHNGYKRVRVTIFNEKGKNSQRVFGVHVLVALAFVPNPNNKPEVNHIDENKKNNYYQNLEWVTHKENSNHGTRGARIGKKTSERYTKNGRLFVVWNENEKYYYRNMRQCERELKLSYAAINKCLKGIQSEHRGYKFKYEE